MPCSRAAATSGLSVLTAVETTTASARATLLRRVADRDARAQCRPAGASRRSRRDRSRAPGSPGWQHLGDAAHAGAADADEVDVLDLVSHRVASSRQTFGDPARRAGLAQRACRAAMRSRRPRSCARAARRAASAREVALQQQHRGAASASNRALSVWWSSTACGNGTSRLRDAGGREFRDRRRAAAADDEVGLGVAARHVVDERRGTRRRRRRARRRAQRVDVRSPAWCVTSGRDASGISASACGTVSFSACAPRLPPTTSTRSGPRGRRSALGRRGQRCDRVAHRIADPFDAPIAAFAEHAGEAGQYAVGTVPRAPGWRAPRRSSVRGSTSGRCARRAIMPPGNVT